MAEGFEDILVVYPSRDDEPGLWVAHSVRTDQVGVGHDPVEAVRELALAIRALFDEAAKDPRVLVEQPAPVEILKAMQTARQIPATMWDRMKAAIEACVQHDDDYWSDDKPDEAFEASAVFYHEVHEDDLCLCQA